MRRGRVLKSAEGLAGAMLGLVGINPNELGEKVSVGIAAGVTGAFSASEAVGSFFVLAIGGALVGLAGEALYAAALQQQVLLVAPGGVISSAPAGACGCAGGLGAVLVLARASGKRSRISSGRWS